MFEREAREYDSLIFSRQIHPYHSSVSREYHLHHSSISRESHSNSNITKYLTRASRSNTGTKKRKEFLSLLREIEHLSVLCLECHRLGPDMTRDLIRYVVEETKIRDLEISFDSTRCGISQGTSLKTSLSSIRRLSLRACNLIDLDPVLSLLLHPRLEELGFE